MMMVQYLMMMGFNVNNSIFNNNGVAIYNTGNLTVNKNSYYGIKEGKTYIYNGGTLSYCIVTILKNMTVRLHPGVDVSLLLVLAVMELV